MNLCYIANADNIYTHRWLAPFIARGDNVTLLSYTPVINPPAGCEVIDLPAHFNAPKIRFGYWGLWIRRYLRQLRPDILHAHQLQGAGWLSVLSGYQPLIVSAWGSDILVEPHKSALRRFLVQRVLKQSERLTVPSRLMYDAALALGYPEAHLRLIPWGIETQIYQATPDDRLETRNRLGIDADAKAILSPRGVTPIYNHDILVDAVAEIVDDFPEIQLILLRFNMDSAYTSGLTARIHTLGLEAHVRWLPAQETRVEMAQLYRMADVTVSIPASDGYGATVYEAMACGSPTLISDLPLFRDELTDRVHTMKAPAGDSHATAQALAALLREPGLWQTIRVNGIEMGQAQSVAQRIGQSLALYEECLA